MAEIDGQEKTEEPTGRKLSNARNEGQVAKSMEINSLAIFFFGFLLLYLTQSYMGEQLIGLTTTIFANLDKIEISVPMFEEYVKKGALFMIAVLGPFLIGVVIVGTIAGYGQVGFKFTPKTIKPKFSKFNPIQGIKKIGFSVRAYVELLKSIAKLVIISLFAYWILEDSIVTALDLFNYPIDNILGFMSSTTIDLLWKIAIVYAIFAAIDFSYQRYDHHEKLKMTKQEVKDEYKQTEGDPQIKSKIKGKQLEIARRRMMQEVPKADVVITNPTHFAVALKYSMEKDNAPKVIAKGVDLVAQKIKKIAAEHNVPIHEDRELARSLYKYCEIGDTIPTELFKAVAQILAYVFQLKNTKKKTIV